MVNKFLEKTRAGKKTVGTFFEFGNEAVAEVLGLTDLDYFIIDCEHGPYDVESAGAIIRSAEGAGSCRVTPFARAKDSSRASILKLLDIGAKGIIIPDVQSLEECKKIVEYGKYAPLGNRGVAVSRSVRYGLDGSTSNPGTWFAECNEKELLIPQCETLGCLDVIEEVAALPGIDGIFVGPYDLSTAMGMTGQFENPVFLDAVKRIVDAVKANSKFVICYVDDAKTAAMRFAAGYNSVALGLDADIYFKAMNRMAAEVAEAAKKNGSVTL